MEERKLVVAQRKLESIRLLDELLERVKVKLNSGKAEVVAPFGLRERRHCGALQQTFLSLTFLFENVTFEKANHFTEFTSVQADFFTPNLIAVVENWNYLRFL